MMKGKVKILTVLTLFLIGILGLSSVSVALQNSDISVVGVEVNDVTLSETTPKDVEKNDELDILVVFDTSATFPTSVTEMEVEIEEMGKTLGDLQNFILPGGSVAASHAHITRSVCRRAERLLVILLDAEPVDHKVLQYINRLSDLFFQLARFINKQAQVEETKWQGIKRPVKK